LAAMRRGRGRTRPPPGFARRPEGVQAALHEGDQPPRPRDAAASASDRRSIGLGLRVGGLGSMVHTVPNWALRCYTINWHSGVQYLYWAWH
jgi:hypothetical protein